MIAKGTLWIRAGAFFIACLCLKLLTIVLFSFDQINTRYVFAIVFSTIEIFFKVFGLFVGKELVQKEEAEMIDNDSIFL